MSSQSSDQQPPPPRLAAPKSKTVRVRDKANFPGLDVSHCPNTWIDREHSGLLVGKLSRLPYTLVEGGSCDGMRCAWFSDRGEDLYALCDGQRNAFSPLAWPSWLREFHALCQSTYRRSEICAHSALRTTSCNVLYIPGPGDGDGDDGTAAVYELPYDEDRWTDDDCVVMHVVLASVTTQEPYAWDGGGGARQKGKVAHRFRSDETDVVFGLSPAGPGAGGQSLEWSADPGSIFVVRGPKSRQAYRPSIRVLRQRGPVYLLTFFAVRGILRAQQYRDKPPARLAESLARQHVVVPAFETAAAAAAKKRKTADE